MRGPPVQVRRGTRVFSSVSTEDSDIPSSCEIKDKPAFKPLQGKPTLFLFRESWYPLHLRQQTQGPSHLPTAEERLLLRCLWKVASPLQSKTGSQLSSWDDIGCMELSSSCFNEYDIHIDLRLVSNGISVVSKRKSRHLFCRMWNSG